MKNLKEQSKKYTFAICYVLAVLVFAGMFYMLMSTQSQLEAAERLKTNLMKDNIELIEANKNLADSFNKIIPLAEEQKKIILEQQDILKRQGELIRLLMEKIEELRRPRDSRSIA